MPTPRDVLRECFGFDGFRPGQEEVIGHLLAGHSAAAVFPTGGGKSLCYQLPALLLPGLTLVVSPLIALMNDQIDQLTRRGVAAGRLDSTLTLDEVRSLMEAVRKGTLRLLYVAPERFNNERFRQAISRVRVSLFAVDEAHCVSEWGHNFRPDYLKLAGLAKLCSAERTLALTATATPQVLLDICRGFGIDPACAVRTGFHRENLAQEIGRAGRDGLPALCEVLVCPDDLPVLQNYAYGDTPDLGAVRGLLAELAGGEDRQELSFYDLAARHDIRLLVVRTLLTYL